MARILVAGGAGYIGSHCCVELLNAGLEVVVFDNLENSKPEALRRVQQITGKELSFIQGDIRDREALDALFRELAIDAVIHFAGLKAVGESSANPLRYYDYNVNGSRVLLQAMAAARVKQMVFSSSATVYGDPDQVPVPETAPLQPANPYGRTKLMVEEMMADLHRADPSWSLVALRYFNPVGAHASGLIGEDPQGIPNNLMPYIAQVAIGQRPELNVFGNDYPTPDGTGVRDYIHVVDLALGHLAALQLLQQPGFNVVNLGTGVGYSVLEVVHAYAEAAGQPVPYAIAPRRAGDVAAYYADPAQAKRLLGWRATRTLADMCADSFRFQQANPTGYPDH